MKSLVEACLLGSILICGAGAQDPQNVVLRQGVSVEMAAAAHAVDMRAADEPNATVVAITAGGKVYLGVKLVEPEQLSTVTEQTVFVKADSRVPYQKVLTVLDALRGKSVVLLAASPANAVRHGMAPPYGVKLILSR